MRFSISELVDSVVVVEYGLFETKEDANSDHNSHDKVYPADLTLSKCIRQEASRD
jgi:hypothetical protein